jgi:hypothetical protein
LGEGSGGEVARAADSNALAARKRGVTAMEASGTAGVGMS